MKRIVSLLVTIVMAFALLATPAVQTASARPSLLLEQGDHGTAVRTVQAKLAQLGYYPWAWIDGDYGPATKSAVIKFQRAKGLPATGVVNDATWSAMKRASRTTRPTTTSSPVMFGPGSSGSGVRTLQNALAKLGYYPAAWVDGKYGPATTTAVKKFQSANGLSSTGSLTRATWDKIKARLAARPAVPRAVDSRCMSGHVACVDKTTRKVYWMEDGRLVKTLDARFGRVGMETRVGTFSIFWKSRDHVSTEFGGSMPFALFFSGGQAIHYSSDFAAVGYNGASHGCVNLRDWNGAKWLFERARTGDKVVVYWS